MLGMFNKNKFKNALWNSLPPEFTLPNEIWDVIKWLEDRKQAFEYRNGGGPFVPTTPVKGVDHLWSHLAFVVEPDLVRHWFGKDGLERLVVPIVKCGADGSHFAIWKNEGKDRFVFLGSEGEAFQLSERVEDFLVLITMGYFSIEGRFSFSLTPKEDCTEYRDGEWPEPIEMKQYIQNTYSVTYPEKGEELLPSEESDPFEEFVQETLK